MKAIKKLASIMICLCLVLGCVAISATAATTGSITIKDPDNSSATINGKSFNIYQVFSAETNGSTTSYSWVEDANGDPAFYDFFFGATNPAIATKSNGTVVEAVEYISNLHEDNGINFLLSQLAEAFHNYIEAKNTATPNLIAPIKTIDKTETEGKKSITVSGLDYGYYLIYDSSELSGGAVRSAVMLSDVTADASVTLKANRPQMAKYVLENDGVTYGKATSADIGDTVEFKIELIVPSRNLYKNYTYYVEDTLPDSMNLDIDSIKVYKNDETTPIDSSKYEVSDPDGDVDFKVNLTDLISDKTNYPANTKLLIIYEAVITDSIIAGVANKNNAVLTYSNDPAESTTGSVSDFANVYTYTFVLTKFAEDTHGNFSTATRLAGAKFEIYKKGSATPIEFIKKPANLVYGGTNTFDVYVVAPEDAANKTSTLEVWGEGEASPGDVENANHFGGLLGDITVFGLAEGEYEIKETVAPVGYYKADKNIYFTITDTTDDSGAVSNLSVSGSYDGTIGSIGNTNGSKANLLTWIDFADQHGDALPETGGMGTTVFTLAGIILMAGAFAFFTSRKRSRAV